MPRGRLGARPLARGLGAIWLLTLIAGRVRRPRAVAAVVAAWLVIPGVPPLPSPALDIAVRLVGQLGMVALSVWAVLAPASGADQSAAAAGNGARIHCS